ncbi:MAG: hypothetical protein ACYC48_01770 [Minisyncoccota bacterium]
MRTFPPRPTGSVTLLVLVFGGIFLAVLVSLSGYLLTQNHLGDTIRVRAEAFSVAEAGLEYYRWHLAHFPTDLKNGTTDPGPYPVIISGSGGGTASLSIVPLTACGQTTSINITSTGTAADNPSFPVTLVARYAQPTVAQYSYIVNDSVWAGADRIINGPYHSNGGIRMDGASNAPVTSSLSSWICTTDFGCSYNTTEPGVFGSGSNQALWQYPTPQVDFNAIATRFPPLKSIASVSGIYLARYSSGNSNSAAYHKGYHLTFNANGTVTVTKVSSVTKMNETPINSTDPLTDYSLINNETSSATYTIPSTCGLIFVEDNTWVDGTIPSKVTLVVASVTDSNVIPTAFLRGNITYSSPSSGFTLISQGDVLITPDSPDDMTLDGIFVAQGGAFGRNYYSCSTYPTYSQKDSLTIVGSTISNKRTGTQWGGSGCGKTYSSGYATRIDSVDRTQYADPPPFTPILSNDYQFITWQQQQ